MTITSVPKYWTCPERVSQICETLGKNEVLQINLIHVTFQPFCFKSQKCIGILVFHNYKLCFSMRKCLQLFGTIGQNISHCGLLLGLFIKIYPTRFISNQYQCNDEGILLIFITMLSIFILICQTLQPKCQYYNAKTHICAITLYNCFVNIYTILSVMVKTFCQYLNSFANIYNDFFSIYNVCQIL